MGLSLDSGLGVGFVETVGVCLVVGMSISEFAVGSLMMFLLAVMPALFSIWC